MTDRTLDELLDAWMDLGPTVAPERVAEAARLEVRSTRQLPAAVGRWAPRRFPDMNSTVRIVLAAAAVVAVAFLGYTYLVAPMVGGPAPSDAPSSASMSAAVASPSDASTAVDFTRLPGGGTELEPGPYLITSASPVEITITVPDEPYESWPSAWYKALYDWGPWHQSNDARLAFVVVDNLYVDPCQPDLGLRDPAVGPTVDELIDALGTIRAISLGPPSAATLDGYSGRMFELTGADSPAACVDEALVWQTTQGEPSLLVPAPGDVTRVWVLDVEGTRLVVLASEDEGFADPSGFQTLIDSIQIAVP